MIQTIKTTKRQTLQLCRKEPCLISNNIYKATITTDKTTNKSNDPREIASNRDTKTTNLHSITLTKDTQQTVKLYLEFKR